MKSIFCITIILCSLFFTSIAQETQNSVLIGTWNYWVSKTPEGLETGTLVFFEKEEILGGKAHAKNGTEMQLLDVELIENKLTFNLYVESDYIRVKATIDGDKMEGIVYTPDSEEKLQAEKIMKQ